MHWALKEPLVPRTESNLRALTCSGEVEEMPNTLLALTSLLPFLWFVCFWKKKKNYNTLLFLTFIKAGFCYFWRKQKMLGTGEILLCPLACDQIHDLRLFPGEGPTCQDCKVPAGLVSPPTPPP